jgi:polyhydroxybutyrate depolymerase
MIGTSRLSVPRAALAFAACLLVMTAAACSSGGSAPATVSPRATATATAAATSSVAARPSPGCGAMASATGATTQQLTIAGAARSYRRYLPVGITATKPLPVVINIHGLGSNVDQQAALSAFEPLADQKQFIVLTPQGLGAVPEWDIAEHDGNVDVQFIGSMLDAVEASVCVDEARVYSTGLSDGGIMSSLLACTMGDRIAAIGLVSGIERPDGCNPGRAVPVIVFWGKQDAILPYCGGIGPALVALFSGKPVPSSTPACPPANFAGFPPVEDAVALWTKANGCDAKPTVAHPGSDVEERTFSGCSDGIVMHFYVVSDGGHTWPGSMLLEAASKTQSGAAIFGVTTDQVDATQLIWSFFTRYALAR